jgi:hypothetical protein
MDPHEGTPPVQRDFMEDQRTDLKWCPEEKAMKGPSFDEYAFIDVPWSKGTKF